MKHFYQALVLWEMLGDIPIDDDGYIDIPYIHFPEGTHREVIWHWFENTFDFSVGIAMNGGYKREQASIH